MTKKATDGIKKTVNLELLGKDGNAFFLMGIFQKQAKREGWTESEIQSVLDEARSDNYDHLLATLMEHCEPKDASDED